MSRDNAGNNRTATSSGTDDDTEPGGKSGLLGRRRFLQVAATGAAAAAGFAGSASAADYKTIKLSAGQHWRHSLSDGETFENVLFDCTASNTRVTLKASARNWTIRNVGIKGVHDQSGGHSVMALNARNNSDCLIENVWMGDGSAVYDGASSSETAAWVSPKSSGTITFRNCFFEGWKDNAIYASACGRDGNGRVVVDNCYARDNNHADFRIGSSGSVVKNSVVEHTGNGSGVRGIWCWYNDDLEVRNCNIDVAGYGAAIHAGPYAPGEVDVYDTQYKGSLVENGQGNGDIRLRSGNGSSPNTSVPAGIPGSAEEAAGGAASGGSSGSSALANTLSVESPDGGAAADYKIVTTGEVQAGSEADDDDSITENDDGTYTITGLCSDGWTDTYRFEGEVSDYAVSGGRLDIVVNGDMINPPETKSLRVESPDNGALARYEITTAGRIFPGDEAESSDEISSNGDGTWTLSGNTGDGYADSFEIEGEVTDYSVSGGRAAIIVDGETLNPVDTSTLRVESPDGGALARYEITTTGQIIPGDEAEGSDEISENGDGTWTLSGMTGDGYADSFTFFGELTDYSVSGGRAAIIVDDERVNDVANVLRVETPDDGALTRYEITTSGQVYPGDEAERSDEISENGDGSYTISGVSGDGYADSFTFEGEVTDYSVTGGQASIVVNGETLNTIESKTMRLETPENGDLVRYEVTTTGQITRGDAAEGSDRITQNDDGTYTLAGVSGDGYADSFQFTGSVESFSKSGGDVTLLVDGQEVQP